MPNRMIMTIAILIGLCMTLPCLAAEKSLDQNSGPWRALIGAEAAKLTITGKDQPFSSVQITVTYSEQTGNCTQRPFPVNVLYLKTATISHRKEGCFIQEISFSCTRGKVDIIARPAGGSYW